MEASSGKAAARRLGVINRCRSPWAWANQSPLLRWGRVALVAGGLVFAIYLVWAELYRLDAICLYCTGVHVAIFLLFVVTLLAEAARLPAEEA